MLTSNESCEVSHRWKLDAAQHWLDFCEKDFVTGIRTLPPLLRPRQTTRHILRSGRSGCASLRGGAVLCASHPAWSERGVIRKTHSGRVCLEAVVEQEPIRCRISPHTASDCIASLKHHRWRARTHTFACTTQPGNASTDDDDGHMLCRQCRYAQQQEYVQHLWVSESQMCTQVTSSRLRARALDLSPSLPACWLCVWVGMK